VRAALRPAHPNKHEGNFRRVMDLILTFKADVSHDRREAILEELARWKGVHAAVPLKRDAAREIYRRYSLVRVDSEYADVVTGALRKLPEVDAVEVAPRRGLLQS